MKFLKIIYQCINVYFVYKKLNKKGLLRTEYSLANILTVGLKHTEELYAIMNQKNEEESDEKKQS